MSDNDDHIHDENGGARTSQPWPKDERKRLAPPPYVSKAGCTTPEDVLEATSLDRTQKIKLLRNWEYDAREQDVAEEEGMISSEKHPLQDILRALHMLGAEPDLDHAPPTKQGGV